MAEKTDIPSFVDAYTSEAKGLIAFEWNGQHAEDFVDSNQQYRAEVTSYVLENPGRAPLCLVSDLFSSHADWSREAWCAPSGFSDLGAILLTRGGGEVVLDFARSLVATFDTFGACHQMQIDPVALRALSAFTKAQLEEEKTESHRKPLEAAAELFTKLESGTAAQGWVSIPPGTPVSNVKIVGKGWQAWAMVKRRLRRLFLGR